ncbi:MAG: PAS domain S-box protein [Thermoplasmata archaeon]|nr:PAS domain S-box protein [Thermoplasmata archaeon]
MLSHSIPFILVPILAIFVVDRRWELYKQFFEESPVGITVVEENGIISFANKKFSQICGYPLAEIIGEHFTKFVAEEDKEMMQDFHERRMRGEDVPQEYEYRCLRKDGKIRHVKIKIIKLPENRTLACKIDVTREREMQELFERIAETALVAIFIYQGGRIVYMNRFAEEITGYSHEEIKNINYWDMVVEEYRDVVRERGKRRERGEDVKPMMYEIPFYTKDGRKRWAFFSMNTIVYKGKPAGIATAVDITEIKEMEAEMEKSREKYRMLVELSQEGICMDDEEGKIVFLNDAFASSLGYKKGELIGRKVAELVYLKDAKKLEREEEKRRKGKKGKYEIRFLAKNGEVKTFIVSSTPLYKDNQFIGSLSVNLDITERKKAEERIIESESLYRAITEYSPNGIFIVQGGKFVFANSKFLNIVGREGKSISDIDYSMLIHPEDREEILKIFSRAKKMEEVSTPEFRLLAGDKIRWGVINGAMIDYKGESAFLGVLTDITEIKEIHEKEKKFIERVSHYFFNPICIAKGYIHLAKERISSEEDVIMLEKAKLAIERVENVVKNIVREGEIHE